MQKSFDLATTANLYHERYNNVLQRIEHAATAVQRIPNTIALLAVSKTKPAQAIAALYAAGQHDFGENYVQEGIDKIAELGELTDITWHFIGALQSNKTKDVAANFDWVHSIDRGKIVHRLNEQRPKHLAPLQCLVQVNIDDEPTKAGVQLSELGEIAEQIDKASHLTLRGIMAIPNPDVSDQEKHNSFQRLENVMQELRAKYPSIDTLSLGMSNDLEAAVAHGSTMVRIGTALFGKR